MKKCININIHKCVLPNDDSYEGSIVFLENMDKILKVVKETGAVLNIYDTLHSEVCELKDSTGRTNVITRLGNYLDLDSEERANLFNINTARRLLKKLLDDNTLKLYDVEELKRFDTIVFIDNVKDRDIIKTLEKNDNVLVHTILYNGPETIDDNSIAILKMLLTSTDINTKT